MAARSLETPTAEEAPVSGINYERLYAYRFRDVDQASRQKVWNEIARYIYGRLGEPRSVLDPAAGRGEFLTAVPAADRWGVDLVRQGDLESAGVKMVIGDIMDIELPREHFDGVFLSNFLEHLPDQDAVATVLAKLRDAMQPGGRIAIMGPNFRYCAKDYFDCADHTVILSHIGIEEHVYAAGFEVESVAPRFLPFSFRGLLPPSATLTRTYLRTPALWRLLGKQFLVLANRKPGAGRDDG
jgi:SAM-dependent methyltransferase